MGRGLVTRSADLLLTTGWPDGKVGIVGPFQIISYNFILLLKDYRYSILLRRYIFHLALFHTTLFLFLYIFLYLLT